MGSKLHFIANVVVVVFSVDRLSNDSKNATLWTYNWACIFNNWCNQGNFAPIKISFDSFLDS